MHKISFHLTETYIRARCEITFVSSSEWRVSRVYLILPGGLEFEIVNSPGSAVLRGELIKLVINNYKFRIGTMINKELSLCL